VQKDLYIVCGAVNEKQFLKFCTLLGKPELAREERFKDNQSRVNNRDDLGKILNELFSAKTTDEWMELFEGTGLPYGPINTMERVFAHPQTEAREMVQEVPYEHATAGKLSLLGESMMLIQSIIESKI
jgi:succinate---hydroxymethylglutarate CoA-transferase